MKSKFKNLLAGLVAVILISVMAGNVVAASIEALASTLPIKINGVEWKTEKPIVTIDGEVYVPIKEYSSALGIKANLNKDATSFDVSNDNSGQGLKATLSNYSPTKNSVTTLNVTGKEYEGMPYKVIVKYKTVDTEYDGVVGKPCDIKVSTATAGYKVVIYISVSDTKNNKEYELVTSFTPPKQK